MHQLCDNQQALDVLLKQVAWVRMRMDRLTQAAQQAMLQTEFGGMNDVLATLYGVTGDPEHLRLARAFDHAAVFDPLAAKTDTLDGLHANTQIPKIIGAAREYEVTGDTRYRDIATYFWNRVARHRSYANGGHSDGEIFFPVDRFEKHLGGESSETCNTYNMLKLTRHLFAWSPSATTMDFYERGLYNHILASQDPASGGVIYYCPLKPGAWKSYSTKDRSFWCCVGTGLENHAKYADTIYFHDSGALFVNLFIPSELTWKDQGVVVRQTTRFPEEGRSHLAFTAERPVRLTLRVRHPFWATSGFGVTVNGVSQPIDSTPGSYLSIVREWATGDTVDLTLPMSLRTEALPGTTDTVALFYGPVLLAGELGSEGLDAAKRYGPSAPPPSKSRRSRCPRWSLADPGRLLASIVPVPNRPLTFRTAGVGQPRDVTLVPFYQANQTRYSVYWKMYSPSAWDTRKAAEAGPEDRAARGRQRRSRRPGKRAIPRVCWREDDAARIRGTNRPRDTGGVVQLRAGGPARPAGRRCSDVPRRRGTATRVRRARGWRDGRKRDAGLSPHRVARKGLRRARDRDPRQAARHSALPTGGRRANGVGVRSAGRGTPGHALILAVAFLQDSPPPLPLQSSAMHTLTASLLSLIVVVAASAGPNAGVRVRGQGAVNVDSLVWLSGCWAQPRPNGLVEEQWMAPRGGSMLGMSRTVIGGTTTEYEFLRIAVVDGALAYVARPSGQAEAAFPLKSIADGVVVFENLSHDFPQRIIYRRSDDASVTARIEGTVKGEARGRDFPYKRCAN